MTKQLDQSEGKLAGILLDNLSAEASTASIRVSFFDKDDPNTARIPDPGTLKFLIDPENSQGKKSEWIRCVSHATLNGITTLTTVTRGLQRDATVDLTGSATRAQSWDASTTPIGVATEPHNNNLMKDYFTGDEPVPGDMEFDGEITFDDLVTMNAPLEMEGASTYFLPPRHTTVSRDALTPQEGMLIRNTDSGFLETYQGGAWVTIDSGTATVNATTAVSGKVEIATSGESIAGTNTGGTGASLMVLPKQIANNIQSGTHIYAESTTGTDAYSATLVPAFTGYANGMRVSIRVDTANTGACTLELNSQGAVSITMPFGGSPITGTILSGSIIDVMFDATNVVWKLMNVSTMLVGGNDASLAHYHNLVKNNALPGNQKHFYRVKDCDKIHDGGGSNQGTVISVQTSALNNNIARIVLNFVANDTSTTKSVHASNPEFRVAGDFTSGTAQEGFIGFVNAAMAGTDLENSVMILDHVGFIVQDGTLFISCGNGAAQTKTDISATVPSVTSGHVFGVLFDGTTATFTVDNASVGTINTTVPDNNLTSFNCAVIADATAAAKTVSLITAGWVAHDE